MNVSAKYKQFGPWGAFIIVFITISSYFFIRKIDNVAAQNSAYYKKSDIRERVIHVEDEVVHIKANLKEMKIDIKEDLREIKDEVKNNRNKLFDIEKDLRKNYYKE